MTDKMSTSRVKIVRKKYSPQFKDQALTRISKDGVPQVAKDLIPILKTSGHTI